MERVKTKKKHLFLRASVSAMAALVMLASGTSVFAVEDTTFKTKTEEVLSMFTTADLMEASISDLQTAMKNGKVTSVELVQMYLNRIEAYDKSLDLNSVILVNDEALELAAQLDAERASGQTRGPLHGIPIVIKDNYDYKGLPTSAGAVALKDSIAPDDAHVVAKLKEAGAVVIAKTNLSEFAMSGRNSRSTLGGTVHNAYDNTRTAAGSSGGSGVAVNANFSTAAIGTDTGSSVRAPSNMSGLYGLRPTYGLTSRDGVVPLNLDNDTTGPLCRTIEDLAIMLDAMAGTDENDFATANASANRPETYLSYINSNGLQGKRIGILKNSFGYTNDEDSSKNVPLDETVAPMVENMKAAFVDGGAEFVDLSDILTEDLIKSLRSGTSAGSVFEWDLNEYLSSLGSDAPMKSMWDIAQTGMNVGHMTSSIENAHNPETDPISNPRETEEYAQAIEKRAYFRSEVERIMDENDIDAIMFVPYTAPANLEEDSQNKSFANPAGYTSYFGPVAGMPEMSIPMGLTGTNDFYTQPLAFGVSLFGRAYDEGTLIEIASGYTAVTGGTRIATTLTPVLEDEALTAYLTDLINETEALKSEEYTAESWNTILEALTAAKAVDKTDVSASYEVTLNLAKAYDALVKLELPTEPITDAPANEPTSAPTEIPTDEPTSAPTNVSTENPTNQPASAPTSANNAAKTDAGKVTTNYTTASTEKTADMIGKVATGDSMTVTVLAGILILAAGSVAVMRKKRV